MMPGDKIDTMQISWDSQRLARDSPLASSSSLAPPSTLLGGANEPPMIAGQLLIYDLDETPPPLNEEAKLTSGSSDQCAITKNGLFFLAMGMGSLSAALLVVTLALFVKLRGAKEVDNGERKTTESTNQPYSHQIAANLPSTIIATKNSLGQSP
uniref:Uncharacterized protein n=1 Tax=Ditylenchus dipsaci TaxID=166011 RepID=A0A915EL38_9BILA